MTGLLLKDVAILKRNLRGVSLFIVLYGSMMLYGGQINFLVSFLQIYPMIMLFSTFNNDDYLKWNKYARSFPLTGREIVGEKYVLLMLLSAGGLVLGLGFLGVGVALKRVESLEATLTVALSMPFAGLLIGGCTIPLAIRFGIEKGRLLFALFGAVLGGIVAAFAITANGANTQSLQISPVMIFLGLAVVCSLLFFLSYLLSLRIYAKKEY